MSIFFIKIKRESKDGHKSIWRSMLPEYWTKDMITLNSYYNVNIIEL